MVIDKKMLSSITIRRGNVAEFILYSTGLEGGDGSKHSFRMKDLGGTSWRIYEDADGFKIEFHGDSEALMLAIFFEWAGKQLKAMLEESNEICKM